MEEGRKNILEEEEGEGKGILWRRSEGEGRMNIMEEK